MIATPLATASWSESEALALQDALSVIDKWDGDLGGLLAVDSDASSSSDVSQPTKRKPKTKTQGAALKHEIMALQAQARDLRCVVALGKALVGRRAPAKPQDLEDLANEWEQLASTQRCRRLTVEAQNAKLKSRMKTQVKFAKRMLRLRSQLDGLKRTLRIPPLPSFVNYNGPSIEPQLHLRDTTSLISHAAGLFATAPYNSKEELQYFHETRFRGDRPPEDGAELESQGVWVLPFDVKRVAEEMWVHTLRPTRSSKTSMDIYVDTHAAVSQIMGTSELDAKFGVVEGQLAARLLPPDLGDGSVLIVLNILANMYSGSQIRGSMVCDGWIRMEPVQAKDSPSGSPVTIVKRYRRTRITHPVASTMSLSERRGWTEAVFASSIHAKFEEGFAETMTIIETMLLSNRPAALGITEISMSYTVMPQR